MTVPVTENTGEGRTNTSPSPRSQARSALGRSLRNHTTRVQTPPLRASKSSATGGDSQPRQEGPPHQGGSAGRSVAQEWAPPAHSPGSPRPLEATDTRPGALMAGVGQSALGGKSSSQPSSPQSVGTDAQGTHSPPEDLHRAPPGPEPLAGPTGATPPRHSRGHSLEAPGTNQETDRSGPRPLTSYPNQHCLPPNGGPWGNTSAQVPEGLCHSGRIGDSQPLRTRLEAKKLPTTNWNPRIPGTWTLQPCPSVGSQAGAPNPEERG